MLGVVLGLGAFGGSSLAGPKEDFTTLEQQMEQAAEAYFKAMDALIDKDGVINIDTRTKLPEDGRVDVLKRMDALAISTTGMPEAGELHLRTFMWAADVDPGRALSLFEKITASYPNEPGVADAVQVAAFAASSTPERDKWIAALDQLARKSTVPDVKSMALYVTGQVLLGDKKFAEAKRTFEQVMKLDPDGDVAKAAKSFIFEIEHLQVGMEAPDFTTTSLEGKSVSLKSLRGKAVLINFWATWCGPCMAEMPHLATVSAKLSEQKTPFEILCVSVDDDRESVAFVVRERKFPGTHTWDKGPENPVTDMYNVRGLPTWYLLDPKGIIRYRDPSHEELVDLVTRMFEPAKPPDTPPAESAPPTPPAANPPAGTKDAPPAENPSKPSNP